MENKKVNYRDEIANLFVEALEKDPIAFIKGWNFADTGKPINGYTELKYNGINALYLKIMESVYGFGDNRWLTFKQINDKGYSLRKGAKGYKVEYYIPYDNEEKRWATFNEFDENKIFVNENGFNQNKYTLKQRIYTVFNASLVYGIKPLDLKIKLNDIKQEQVIEQISKRLNIPIIEQFNSNAAYYSISQDSIFIPSKEQFNTQGDYVSTVLHELGHATGHSERLNREFSSKFGDEKYAFEELVAEITSGFMSEYVDCARSDDVLNRHKAYIQSWAKMIKNNKQVLFDAIKEANKAADYIVEKANLKEFINDLNKEKTLNSNDYWIVAFNESSDFIQTSYKGRMVNKELIDELKKLDEKIKFHNKIIDINEYVEMTNESVGYSKFYFDHIIDGKVEEHLRIDLGDGNEVNERYFQYLYEQIDKEKEIPNEIEEEYEYEDDVMEM